MIIMIIVRETAPLSPTRVGVSDVGKDQSLIVVLMDATNDANDTRMYYSEGNNIS